MANFIEKKELYSEILLSQKNGSLTPRAFEMLQRIVIECTRKFKYKYPEDKEDCISFAIQDMLLYWHKYNPEISNEVFAYYTQMAKYGLAKGWNKLHPIKSSKFVPLSDIDGIKNI